MTKMVPEAGEREAMFPLALSGPVRRAALD